MSATDVKVDMPPCEDVKSNVTISPERRARVRKALVKKLRSTSSFVVAINRLANPTSSVAAFASWDAPKPAAEHEEYVFPADRFFKAVGGMVPALKPLAKINGTMPDFATYCAQGPWLLRFADAMLRGTSQVVIVNNSLAGALIFIALWIPSSGNEAAWSSHAYVAFNGFLSLAGATAFAMLSGIDANGVQCGLFGYNGILVGLALATFLEGGWDLVGLRTMIASPILGALSTLLQCALGNLLVPTFKTPPFTLAFNFTMIWFILGAVSKFGSFHALYFLAPGIPTMTHLETEVPHPTEESCGGLYDLHLGFVLRAALTSVGQIFLCGSWASGLIMLVGTAVCSRVMALALFFGALEAVLLGLALAVPCNEIDFGLWGYNSALTATAVLTFFAPTRTAVVMAAFGVVLTVILDGAFKQMMAPFGAPAGTLPFCAAALLLVLAQGKVAGFSAVPLPDVSTPEDHLISLRTDPEGRKLVLLTKQK